jgi:hypothetical protein
MKANMRLGKRQRQIVCGIGVAMCMSGFTFSVRQYMFSGLEMRMVGALVLQNQKVESIDGATPKDERLISLLEMELNANQRLASQGRETLNEILKGARRHSLVESGFFLIAFGLFSALLLDKSNSRDAYSGS